MDYTKLSLIDEQTSPLFRIMSVYDSSNPSRRNFQNNVSAFHIGNGLILSVAHNLRSSAQIPISLPEDYFQKEIVEKLDPSQTEVINSFYNLDSQLNKRFLAIASSEQINQLVNILNQIKFDSRWITFYKEEICTPCLVVQFRNNQFYNDREATRFINSDYYFHEQALSRYTFILELELVEAFYNQDIAIYRIINSDERVIDKIPYLELDFEFYESTNNNFFCLQSAPIDNLGRLLNNAQIEGQLDHWNCFVDQHDGNYIMDGLRYLIKGYFRFGSSGAPYLIYDDTNKTFKVNAIQSEASPIQLSINNNREGNFQYINAIGTPVGSIKKQLEKLIKNP